MIRGTPEVRSNKSLTLLIFDIWYLTSDIWTFEHTGLRPAFGRQGLGGSSDGYTLEVVSMPRFAPSALSSALNQHTLSRISQSVIRYWRRAPMTRQQSSHWQRTLTDLSATTLLICSSEWPISKKITNLELRTTCQQKCHWRGAPNYLSAKTLLTCGLEWPVSKNVTDVELWMTAKTSLTWGPEWPVSKKCHWHGAPNAETLEHWNIGKLEYLNIGTLKDWKMETFDLSNVGTLEHWNIETLELWNIETLELWNIRTLEH